MSSQDTANLAAKPSGSRIARVGRAWRSLPADRQLAAAAALGLCLTLFLPWYEETGFRSGTKSLQATAASLTGWHAFSWVEAALLLVAISVLALLLLRAEGRAFHLPGGDGFIVMLAGGWTCLLLIWRIFDKQGATSHQGEFGTTFGIKWGIFTALGVAALLTYAGVRIRAAHQPEPLLPGEEPGARGPRARPRGDSTARRRARRAAPPGTAPTPTALATGAARAAKRAGSPRRASWAEPVTWEEPTVLSEPTLARETTAETDDTAPTIVRKHRAPDALEQRPGTQLSIPLEDEQPD